MSGNDNAMARFLFAILRQKNLKDIDWNQVAHDPVLAQPISNGHAARMRWSRFRTQMLGVEPQRRNRTDSKGARVTKSKKDAKPKKEDNNKSEPIGEPSSSKTLGKSATPRIKEESPMPSLESRLTPGSASMTPIAPATAPTVIQPRFLTPMSDTDAYVPAGHNMMATVSPADDIMHSETSYDFPQQDSQNSTSWHQAMYSTFDVAYPFEDFTIASDTAGSSQQHIPQQLSELYNSGSPTEVLERHDDNSSIKNEPWGTQYH